MHYIRQNDTRTGLVLWLVPDNQQLCVTLLGHTLLIQNRKTKPPTHNYSTFAGTQTLTQS